MSSDVHWNIDNYREEHESDEHWQLRRTFMERWKNNYTEERLVCLARVFANIELLGCRYPTEVMQEVSQLSHDVAQAYRNSRKNKLQRTFVSASDAEEDRARGVKREGGVVVEARPNKSAKIQFVPQGFVASSEPTESQSKNNSDYDGDCEIVDEIAEKVEEKSSSEVDTNEYLMEFAKMKCLNIRSFHDGMFESEFGKMVLLVRPWTGKLSNIQASCQACNVLLTNTYENGCFSLSMNTKLVARATGPSKAEARSIVETMAWNRLREVLVSIVLKQQWIAHGDARISVSDVSNRGGGRDEFGTPVENSVATKMMQMMGWKGGGLGAGAQGIAEPIKPNLQMVNRAGLGSQSSDIRQIRRAAQSLMQRYIASDTLDLDLVFSSEFSKEERAEMHKCAQRAGLASRSYGGDKDRFLVVRKKLDPFSLVHAVLEKGGNTPKYQVFLPVELSKKNGRWK